MGGGVISNKNAKPKNKRVLVLSAHADDHLTCAGTLFKLRDQGYELFEIVLTDSSEGRDFSAPASATATKEEIINMRSRELSEASKFLGISKTFSLGQEDLGLTYSKKLMLDIVPIIREVQPEIGIIMNSFDWHPDHRETFKIGSEAFKWAGSTVKPELGDFWRTPIVLVSEGMIPAPVSVLVDITGYEEKKEQLFLKYVSQASDKAVKFEKSMSNVRGYALRRPNSFSAEGYSFDPSSPAILFDVGTPTAMGLKEPFD